MPGASVAAVEYKIMLWNWKVYTTEADKGKPLNSRIIIIIDTCTVSKCVHLTS